MKAGGAQRAHLSGGDLYAGLSLQRLQVFVAVAEHGGFSSAAAYLDLGQPTVSFHIKALERLLGARLLVYRERRVHLTAEGDALYRFAAELLRETERVTATIRNIRDGQVGQVRIGASMAFELPAFFQLVVAPFQRAHPRVQLGVEFGHSLRLAEAVHDKRLDLAYVVNWRLPAGARYSRLHEARFILMVAPEHALARKRRVTSEDVYEAGLIAAPTVSQEWPHYEHLLRSAGLSTYRVGLEIDGVQARLTATQRARGHGRVRTALRGGGPDESLASVAIGGAGAARGIRPGAAAAARANHRGAAAGGVAALGEP